MKTTIIYEKTTRTYRKDNWSGEGNWSPPLAEHAIFTEPAALARQIREVLYLPDVEEWNHDGPYDWCVEPSYAEGCMWFEMLSNAKSFIRVVAEAYDAPLDKMLSIGDFYPCEAEEWGGLFDERPTVAFSNNGHVPNIYSDFGGELQAELQHGLPNAKKWWDDMLTIAGEQLPARSFEFHDYEHEYTETHRFLVLTRAPAEELARIYGAELNRTLMEADQMRYEAYAASPEGKAEAKAHAERERELNTMMGEGGYTSYSRSDDGTIRMWRD